MVMSFTWVNLWFLIIIFPKKGGIYHKYMTSRYNHTRSKYTKGWAIDHCNSLHLSADIEGLKPFVNTWHNCEKMMGMQSGKHVDWK